MTAPTMLRLRWDVGSPAALVETTPMAAFIDANYESQEVLEAVIRACDTGQPVAVGGGASPLVVIEVLT